MNNRLIVLGDGRKLLVGSAKDSLTDLKALLGGNFSTMLPAFNCDENSYNETIWNLVEAGCDEFCCFGPMSEELHDEIDWLLVDKGYIDVVTTWHNDVVEGCEYFAIAAGGGLNNLLCLAGDLTEITALLERLSNEVE